MNADPTRKLLDTVIVNTLETLVRIDLSSAEAGTLLAQLDVTLRMLESKRDLAPDCAQQIRDARHLYAGLMHKRFSGRQLTRH